MTRISHRASFAALAVAFAAVAASLSAGGQAQGGRVVALVGARLIDGTGRMPIERSALVIGADGRVQAVGAGDAITIPSGATRVDLSGKTIMPGMINAHAHLNYDKQLGGPVRDQLIRRLRTYAAYGVTAAVSLGSTEADEQDGLKLRDEQSRGGLDRARIFTGGLNAVGKTPEEARKSVDRLADLKVDIIKFHINGNADDMKPDTWRAIIDESHKKNLRVAVHIFYAKDAQAAIDSGVDVIAHSVRDQNVTPALINAFKSHNVGYVPTLTRDLSVFVYETRPAFFDDPFFKRGWDIYRLEVETLSDPARQAKVKSDKQAQAIKPALEQALKNLKLLSDAGVTIAMGTDSGAEGNPGRWQGYFEHVELEYMVKAGLTPMQAIVAASSGAAKAMKLADLGSLQPGKQADLVVLGANPIADIKNTRRIESVWIGGRRIGQ